MLTQDLEAVFEPGAAEGPQVELGNRETVKKESRLLFVGVAFGVGLLLGWLVIGWWLWPVQWSGSAPWYLAPQYQRAYIGLVAEEYWRTSDVSRAKEALAGWDRKSLANLLATMETEISNAETRRHLAALAEAMDMPSSEVSLTSSLWRQKGLILAMILAMAPSLVAVVLVAAPWLRKRRQPPQELPGQEDQLEGGLEELLAGVQMEAAPGEASPQAAQERTEEEEDEEQTPKEEESAEEEPAAGLGDLLSLFEEEDTTLAATEMLCKDLPELPVAELLENATRVASQLRKSNELRAFEAQ